MADEQDQPSGEGPQTGGSEQNAQPEEGKETIDDIVARLKRETGITTELERPPVDESDPSDTVIRIEKDPKGKVRAAEAAPKVSVAAAPPRTPEKGAKPASREDWMHGSPKRGKQALFNVSEGSKHEGGRIRMNGEGSRARFLGLMIGMIIIILSVMGVMLDMLEIIPAGHKGVIITSPGGPSLDEVNEGYQFGTRYIWADVEIVEYRTQTVHFVGADYSDDEKGSIQIITNDSMPIFLDLSVVYHIQEDRVADLIIENGKDYQNRIIYPYVRSIARDVASRYQALDIIGEKRSAVETTIQQNIITKMAEKNIIVEGVPMRDVRIPSNLESAIISKKVAEQAVLTEQYNLIARQYIANQTIVNAQANATAYVVEQTGFANGTVVRAMGQAEAMERIIAALNSTSYDNRTKDYLTWAYIQALTDPNTKVKFVVIPASGTPIILDTSAEQ